MSMSDQENEIMDGDEAAGAEVSEAVDAPEPDAKPQPSAAEVRARESAAANAAFDEAEDDDMSDIEEVEAEEVDPELVRLLEGVLFASSEPVAERALLRRLPEGVNVKPLLHELKSFYDGRGVNLVRRGGSWGFRTAPDLGQRLNLEIEVARKLSRAAIETLAIIAYHQPVTRGEIEEIRGVSLSKGTLDVLFEEGWIKPRGHRDTPGRPLQWGTTDNFLDHFGLESVAQLPGLKDLRAMGLLDARPALEAYTVRGEMKSSEEVQEDMDFNEAEIVAAERHVEDNDVSVEVGPEAAPLIPPKPKVEPEEELDASGATKKTADKLDAAMEAVAGAVKSAVKALESDDDEEEEEGRNDPAASV